MNSNVVPYEQSSFPNIALHVYSATDSTTMIEPTRINDGRVVYIQDGPRDEYIVKLHIPPEDLKSGALADIQYVMDVSLSSPATFSGGNRGCDNRRAHGRPNIDTVKLKIDFDGEAADETDAGDEVKVWAGWATGHEAVQLTDAIVFLQKEHLEDVPVPVEDPGSVEDAGGDVGKKDTVEVPEDARRMAAAALDNYEGGGKSKSLSEGERRANAKERLDEMRQNVHHVDGGHDHKRVIEEQMGHTNKKRRKAGGDEDDGDDDDGSNEGTKRQQHTKPKSQNPPNKKKKYIPSGPRPVEGDESSFGAFRRRYHKHELGLQQFSMGGYLAGCFLLATLGLVLAKYSELVGKRLHKGSRTL